MSKKIIVWLNADITEFGVCYYLQKFAAYEIYAIIDITNKPKHFYETQNLVKFKQIWFYHDLIKNSTSVESNFLKSFEEKYDIPVKKLAKNDRIFMNKFNEFYKFSDTEISNILINECKSFEKIINDVNPDIFLTLETALRPHHFFYLLCKKKGVKILMLNAANWGDYCYISEEYHRLNNFKELFENKTSISAEFGDLQKLLENNVSSKKHTKFFSVQQKSKISRIKAIIKTLIFSDMSTTKSHYTYYGRTKFKLIFNEILIRFKRYSRKKFIDKNFLYEIPDNNKFIFFPLQQEPERSLLISTPDYIDQLNTINLILKSLPEDYILVVKEHPTQGPPNRDWRKISDYKSLLENPKIQLIHPSINAKHIIKKSSLVISVSGTISLESSFFNIPSITFANNDYPLIKSISKMDSISNLNFLIMDSMKKNTNPSDVKNYFDILMENSFEFDLLDFQVTYLKYLYLDANLLDIEITEKQMKLLLDNQKDNLMNLAKNFERQINLNF